MSFKRGIDKAVEVAVSEIKRLSREVKGEMISQAARLAPTPTKQIGSITA